MWRTCSRIASVLTLAAGLNAQQFVQGPGSPFPSKSTPAAIAVADFNGDLIPDLAIANQANNNVTIYLGDGTGLFNLAMSSPITAPIGTSPSSLVAADFNGDGNMDLAVANLNSKNVSILLGDGTGNFSAASGSPITVGNLPSAIVAGTFNLTNNGHIDLAVANKLDNTVWILLGNGDGTFTTGSTIALAPAGTGPSAIAVGKFNAASPNDSVDLAVVNLGTNNISILLGNGMGSFTLQTPIAVPPPTGAPPNQPPDPISIASADFNNDMADDLAIANENNNTVTVLLQQGTGGFSQAIGSPFTVGSEPVSVAAADFNKDGNQDLAVVNYRDGTVSILLGNGNLGSPVTPGAMQFTAASGSPFNVGGSLPHFVAIGDFNVDGKPDLAIANGESNNVSVLLNAIYSPSMVSSADGITTVGPGSIVSIYGTAIATSTATAPAPPPPPANPLPTSLGGASVTFSDSTHTQSSLSLFYASPTQINALIPATAAAGTATFTINSGPTPQTGSVTVATLAPGIFSANQTGKGVAEAQYVTTLPTGFQNVTDVFQCPAGAASCITVPINVSMNTTTNQGVLVLYGTGFAATATAMVNITGQSIGSQTSTIKATYAGPSGMMGVGQVNVALPATLAGTGLANVSVQFVGSGSTTPVTSNVVTIYIQ